MRFLTGFLCAICLLGLVGADKKTRLTVDTAFIKELATDHIKLVNKMGISGMTPTGVSFSTAKIEGSVTIFSTSDGDGESINAICINSKIGQIKIMAYKGLTMQVETDKETVDFDLLKMTGPGITHTKKVK